MYTTKFDKDLKDILYKFEGKKNHTMTGNEKYVCPLLKNPERYNPDTLNLVENLQARNYWLPCLEQMVKKFVSKAQYLHPDDPKATEKAEVCYQDFHNLLEQLTSDPKQLNDLATPTIVTYEI
uniref:Pantothenate kinase 4-like isoform X1 n=2 Tax=Diabrotica virgifera virgifera TaxID=50390 RepID=A0A6P7H613_DIAVI